MISINQLAISHRILSGRQMASILAVQKLGNEKEVIRAIINKLNGNISYNCVLNDALVTIDGYSIHVRGKVIDGVLKIGTIFIP